MTSKEWARLALIAICLNAWWAFATAPKHPEFAAIGVASALAIAIWACRGIIDNWDD